MSFPDNSIEVVSVSWTADATVGQLADELIAYNQTEDLDFDWSLWIWSGRVRLERDAPLSECQLFHRQDVILGWTDTNRTVGVLPVAPSDAEAIRLRHVSGPQLGIAWPLWPGSSLFLRRDGDFLVPVQEGDAELVFRLADESVSAEPLITVLAGAEMMTVDGSEVAGPMPIDTEFEVSFPEHPPLRVRVCSNAQYLRDLSPDGRAVYVPGLGALRAETMPPPAVIRLPRRPVPQLPDPRWGMRLLQVIPMLTMSAVLMFVNAWAILGVIAVVAVTLITPQIERHYAVRRAEEEQNKWAEDADLIAGRHTLAVDDERRVLIDVSPSLKSLLMQTRERSGSLWELRPDDFWFMRIPVGLTTWKSPSHVVVDAELTDSTGVQWASLFDTQRLRPSTPHLISLVDYHLGVAGNREFVREIVGGLVARIAATHDPAGLAVGIFCQERHRLDWDWLQSTPHLSSPSFWSSESRLYSSAEEVAQFLQESTIAATERDLPEHLLLIVDDLSLVSQAALEELVKLSSDRGARRVHYIVTAPSPTALPRVVEISVAPLSEEIALIDSHLEDLDYPLELAPFDFDESTAYSLVDSLSGITSERVVAAGRALPGRVAIGQLLAPDVAGLWQHTAKDALGAPLGVSDRGEMWFDLVEQGPHVLIGGTTGSGKSELLRTLVLGLAARYSPDECQLLLLDYKGGATFADLTTLPHVIGAVSNLEGKDVARVIEFLEGELEHRQSVLQSHGGEYARLPRPDQRVELARLVVIIDEFAAFLDDGNSRRSKAILGLAARGRSLGLHLVIATQSPQQVVDRQVRANVNARIALRTLDSSGSESIIGTDAAARIHREQRGRAFIRLDSEELIAFQSAATGDVWLDSDVSKQSVTVRGRRYREPPELASGATDAQYLINRAAILEPMQIRPKRLFLSRLETQDAHTFTPGARSASPLLLGRVDLPRQQLQADLQWSTDGSGILVSVPSSWRVNPFVEAILKQLPIGTPCVHLCFTRQPASGYLIDPLGRSIADASPSDLMELSLQIENLPFAPAPVAVAVLERLDAVLDNLTESDRNVVLRSLADASARGVLVIATLEQAAKAPVKLASSMNWYRFEGPRYTFADRDDNEVRLFADLSPLRSERIEIPLRDSPLAFGRMPAKQGSLATDRRTGAELRLTSGNTWLATAPRGVGRNRLALQIAKNHFIQTGTAPLVWSWTEWPLPDYLMSLHDVLNEFAPLTISDYVTHAFAEGDPTAMVLITEIERMEASALAVRPPKLHWLGSYTLRDFLNSLNRSGITTATFRAANSRAIQSQAGEAEHVGEGNILVLSPMEQDRLGNTGSAGSVISRFLAAAPGRTYGPDDGLLVVDGQRHEVIFSWDEDVRELAGALAEERIFL